MKSPLPNGRNFSIVNNLIAENKLNTICSSGNCPNRGECWNAGTASFMILGDKCTRNCRFCYVSNDIPEPVDWLEPLRLAKTIQTLKLKHCVITSVTRDDLKDGGAEFWARTIRKVKELNPGLTIETLIPDLNADPELIHQIVEAGPDVISHNMETVRRLTPKVRSTARYDRSLQVIAIISASGIVSKSGIMVGLGETEEEVIQTMTDLRAVGCNVLTIGQYLQPDVNLLPVVEYVKPEIFEKYRIEGLKKGFSIVESSPLVRSSYHAEKHVNG
jgi:lipoic acid synthetase